MDARLETRLFRAQRMYERETQVTSTRPLDRDQTTIKITDPIETERKKTKDFRKSVVNRDRKEVEIYLPIVEPLAQRRQSGISRSLPRLSRSSD